jgi:tRNA threonylcarbamoyladenosine biosynthesis protein TsaB
MGKPVVGVSTLEALAMYALPYGKIICPMLDARRNEVFTALFRSGSEGFPEAMMPEALIDIDKFLKELEKGEIVFLGSGAIRHDKRIVGMLHQRALAGGKGGERILASAVGLIGLHRYRQGHILDTQTFVPNYLRLSDAESQRAIRSLRCLVAPEG